MKRTLNFEKACGTQARASCRYRNWTDAHWIEKAQRIALVLNHKHSKSSKKMPKLDEILILNEVENLKVVSTVLDHYRSPDWKTRAWLPDSDPRGITSAIVSTLPSQGPPILHRPVEAPHNRGILEARLIYLDRQLAVFAFHFPSQLASPKDRKKMLEHLENLVRQREAAGFIVVAGGDSNMSQIEQEEWIQAQEGPLANNLSHHWGRTKARGTYAFDGNWTFFDWIYVSKDYREAKGTKAKFEVLNHLRAQKKEDLSPEGFISPARPGVSDHFPVMVTLKKAL
jgi:hypothetical protein